LLGYSIAVSVIAIMMSIGGIVFGLGYAFDNKKLKDFGWNELIQSVINGVIVGALFFAFSSHGAIAQAINDVVISSNVSATCQGYMSNNYAICFAYNYLVGLSPVKINGSSYLSLLDSSLALLIPISLLYMGLGVLSSVQLNLGLFSIGLSAALGPILSQQKYIIEALIFAIIGIYTQATLLNVVAVVALPLLLPIGIILRTLYVTRRLGGAIMAIAIGLFAVFPLTYLLDAQVSATFSTALNQSNLNSVSIQTQSLQSLVSEGTFASNTQQESSIFSSISNAANDLVNSFINLFKKEADYVAMLIVNVFFMPLLSVMLTIISIREFARLFGTEIDLGKFIRI